MFEMSMKFFRSSMRVGAISVIVAMAGPSVALSAERLDEFYGTWLPPDQNAKCRAVANSGEGPQLTIGKNALEFGDGAPCEEVKMMLAHGKLRVSASCGWEAGYRAIADEFELRKPGVLIYKKQKYVRCIP
jgi:hypothetical protein